MRLPLPTGLPGGTGRCNCLMGWLGITCCLYIRHPGGAGGYNLTHPPCPRGGALASIVASPTSRQSNFDYHKPKWKKKGKTMLRVGVCARALHARQNAKRDVRLVCSLCLSGWVGVFSEDGGGVTFFVWRSPAGVEKDEQCVNRQI